MPGADLKPLALRISITDRCSLRCLYCMPAEGVPKIRHQDVISLEEIVRFVRVLKRGPGLSKVRLTGGEPLVRAGVVDLVRMLAGEGVPDLALTTNGQHLEGLAADLKAAGLMRLNVSLDTLDPDRYRALTRGGDVERVKAGIRQALAVGLNPVKLNSVVLRGINDAGLVELARWAFGQGVTLRFLELMPIGCAEERFPEWFVPSAEVRSRLERAFRLAALPHPAAESARSFAVFEGQQRLGVLGLISSESAPFCAGCNRLRLTSTGQIIPCLTHAAGPSIRARLRSGAPDAEQQILRLVEEQMAQKCRRSGFELAGPMATVGG